MRSSAALTFVAALTAMLWGAVFALLTTPMNNGGADWPHVELQANLGTGLDPRRQQIIELALSQLGKPYTLGADGPDTFDCSGLVAWSYRQIGVETTRTTFTQLDALPAVEPAQLEPGDLIYFQFPTDQHTGILADVDGDGRWDMIQSGGYFDAMNVNVLYNIFEDHPTFTNAIIGYRRAL